MQSCLPVSSPDQGVYAVTTTHMEIMFAQLIGNASVSLVPTCATRLFRNSL